MTRAVLDEVVPADFASLFEGTELDVSPFPDEWRSASDGAILDLISAAGFDWLVTCDKQMPFQKNLEDKPIAVAVLPTPQLPDLRRIASAVADALASPEPGHFVVLDRTGKRKGEPVAHAIGKRRRKK